MRRPVLLIFVNAMILLVVFALLAQSLVVVQRLAQAQALSGRVEVQRGGRGAFRALSANEFVKTGDVVRTARDGRVEFAWADGTRWKLLPGSLLQVKKASTNTVEGAEQSVLLLSSGKVFVRAARLPRRGSRFEIETPSALARVRGTIFSIEVKPGQTQVQVWKGEVALSNAGGRSATVGAGHWAGVDQNGVSSVADASIEPLFAAEKSMVRPPLSVDAQALVDGAVVVSGRTEAGDEVRVNGQSARVLGNGAFRLKLKSARDEQVSVQARDIHGATTDWSGVATAAPVPLEAQ